MGVIFIDSPSGHICDTGTHNVWVVVGNFGTTTITSATISWDVNSIAQKDFLWTGKLVSGFTKDTICIGKFDFSSIKTVYRIGATITRVNGISVTPTANDSAISYYGIGMQGNYLIDNSGKGSPDYKSFREAVVDLNLKGVCGSTVFNVADGYYNESIEIKSILGSSSVNSITFQSKSLDPAKVILDTSWSGSYNSPGYTLQLKQVNHITFRYMTIQNIPNTSYGYSGVVNITGNSNYNTLDHNIIKGSTSSIGTYSPAIKNDLNTVDEYNAVTNNLIYGGYFGVYFGTTSKEEFGNIVSGNVIDSSIAFGAYFYAQDSMICINNKITMNSGAFYGLYMDSVLARGSGKDETIIANNFITDLSGSGGYAFYANGTLFNIYFNSIYSANSLSGYYAMYVNNSRPTGTIRILNNCVDADGGGPSLMAKGVSFSDNNNWYSNGGSVLANWNGTKCKTLSDIRSVNSMDSNSVSGDPGYYDPFNGDLHATLSSGILKSAGIPISYIPDDIDGQARNTSAPYIGADEIMTDDVGVSAILSPSDSLCGDSSQAVKLKIRNLGFNDENNNFNVHIEINGATSVSVSKAFTGGLPAGKDTSLSYSFSPPLNTSKGGIYSIKAYTDLKGDRDSTNDTIRSIFKTFSLPDARFRGYGDSSYVLTGDFSAIDSTLYSYSWNFGDSSKLNSGRYTSHRYTYSGKYHITLTVSNLHGCMNSFTDSLKLIETGIIKKSNCSNINIYPNPFNEYTAINYTLEKPESVKIEVLDLMGRVVATLVNANQATGDYNVKFNPKSYGYTNAGIYFVRMKIGGQMIEKEITLLK